MKHWRQAVLVAGGAMLVSAPLVFAQATDLEFKCEQSQSKASAKFVGAKSKCIQKCLAGAWKGLNPFSDCASPYAGATLQCISDTVNGLKGAEDKFRAAIIKACTPDCPECFSGGDCTAGGYAGDQVTNIENQVDSFVPGVGCELAGADKFEQKCQLTTAKLLSKEVASVTKCYDKCESNARKGLVPSAGDCLPPTSDVPTAACVAKAEGKAILGIDKICGPECFGGDTTCGSNTGNCSNDALAQCGCDADCGSLAARPDCGGPDNYNRGSTWVNLVDIAISGNVPGNYCE